MGARLNFLWLNNLIKKIVRARIRPQMGYLGSAALSLVAVFLSLYLKKFSGMTGLPITVLATVIAAIAWGTGPGILAAVISAISIDIFVIEPSGLENLSWYSYVRLLMYIFVSVVVSFLVSAIRESFTEAEAARSLAERASSEKDAVIEFLSHDLRGPLSSISLSFQLVQKYLDVGSKEKEIRRLAGNGVFFCHRMAQLIQNLLDASKIKSGGITLVPSVQNVGEIMSEVYDEHRLLADEKQLSFHFEIPNEDFFVNCDRVLLAQVFANLIQNAFKFTPQGGSVILQLAKVKDKILINIHDTGQGIPSAQLPHIFEKFWQAKKLTGEGAGLGLFISRAIVEAHRGEISVRSSPDGGTSFSILLPEAGAIESEKIDEKSQVSLCRAAEHKTA